MNRIKEIDLAKGIMILSVMIGHISYWCCTICGSNLLIDCKLIGRVASVFGGYEMMGFFILSGYCSNFDKPFIGILTSGIRKLLVPTLVVMLLINCLFGLLYGRSPLPEMWDTIINLGGQWFVVSMFFARLIYWVLKKNIRCQAYLLVSLLLVSFSGLILNQVDLFPNIWSHRQTLFFVLFLGIGQFLKGKKIPLINHWFLAAYLLLSFIFKYLLHCSYPSVCAVIHASCWDIITLIIIGVSGTIAIVSVCKLISWCRALEYIGRNSLVFYICHQSFLISTITAVSYHIVQYQSNWLVGCFIYLLLFLVCIIPSCLFTLVLRKSKIVN